jgi:hypothetical protein
LISPHPLILFSSYLPLPSPSLNCRPRTRQQPTPHSHNYSCCEGGVWVACLFTLREQEAGAWAAKQTRIGQGEGGKGHRSPCSGDDPGGVNTHRGSLRGETTWLKCPRSTALSACDRNNRSVTGRRTLRSDAGIGVR